MNIDYSLMGKRLAKIRRKKGLTQEKLAEITDLANNYISNIENNRSIPSLETLVKLCSALDVTPDEVLIGVSSESQNYMDRELLTMIEKCTPSERRILYGIIELIISNRE